ncbi:MAG: hypothetical protein LUQ07_07530 [Methanospirillum sp.]|nr:hypothetical protein [Methanospirillum sp.]
MGDFISTSVTKAASRTLASPVTDIASFNTIVNGVVSDNPWGCTSYESGGRTLAPVRVTKQYVSGKVVFENTEGSTVGTISVNAPSSSAFETDISTILANAALATAMGGTASHDSSGDNFSTALSCHATNGEVFKVTFTREKVTISGYEDDSILTTIETWADTVAALA